MQTKIKLIKMYADVEKVSSVGILYAIYFVGATIPFLLMLRSYLIAFRHTKYRNLHFVGPRINLDLCLWRRFSIHFHCICNGIMCIYIELNPIWPTCWHRFSSSSLVRFNYNMWFAYYCLYKGIQVHICHLLE